MKRGGLGWAEPLDRQAEALNERIPGASFGESRSDRAALVNITRRTCPASYSSTTAHISARPDRAAPALARTLDLSTPPFRNPADRSAGGPGRVLDRLDRRSPSVRNE
ncbi:hypothetical protein AOLI_G00243830 [Acnodon oligacanthus]